MLELYLILSACGIPLGVLIGWWIMFGQPKAKSNTLRRKFFSIGDLRGRTRAQIEAVVGPPSSFSALLGSKTNYTWTAPRYHITLRFDNDICEGVTSEISV